MTNRKQVKRMPRWAYQDDEVMIEKFIELFNSYYSQELMELLRKDTQYRRQIISVYYSAVNDYFQKGAVYGRDQDSMLRWFDETVLTKLREQKDASTT